MDARRLRDALRRQGISVHENDPVLDMAVICDAALADTLKTIENVVNAAADRTSAAAAQTVEASRKAAEAIVNEAAQFLVNQVREAAEEASRTMLTALRQEAARAERASRKATISSWLAVSVSVFLLAGVVGMLVAGARVGL